MNLFRPHLNLDNLTYKEVENLCKNCTLCNLHKTRKNVVFGSGPVPCDVMLIGEGPGEDEDEQGLPFVGKAGQLLTKIFESVNIDRNKEVYITNVVKCRPPQNRTPNNEETEACFPYLEAQINLIDPKIIILAGSPACKVVLQTQEPISKIRGTWFKYKNDISVIPIFHPSYLLRNPSREKGSPKWLTWQDMIEIKNAIDCIRKVKELEKDEK